MKVGIITLHYPHNFGAMLQAYALRETVSSLGADVEFINYVTRPKEMQYIAPRKVPIKAFSNPLSGARRYYWHLADKRFEKENQWSWSRFQEFFEKRLEVQSPVIRHTYELLDSEYDAVICGSDQIWNPDVVKGLRREYFADINPKVRKIAYAASMGDVQTAKRCKFFLKNEIQKMDFVAVREQDLQDFIRNEFHIETELVVDPTLLLTADTYRQIEKQPAVSGDYITVYNIKGRPNHVSKTAKKVAGVYGVPVKEISGKLLSGSSAGYERVAAGGPEEFLGWIDQAKAVVTDSFHGVALSIVFHKDFYFVPRGRTERIRSLLDLLGLNNRIIGPEANVDIERHIDYTQVDLRLNKLRESSIAYLKKSLFSEISQNTKVCSYLISHDKKDCYGCGTCMQVCPKEAIQMQRDENGFPYPVINTEKCISCKVCEKKCPLEGRLSAYPVRSQIPKSYIAVHQREEERWKSSSGGIYAALTDAILRENGVVYGAVMDEHLQTHHERAETPEQRDRQRKSKYVQSDAAVVFCQVKEDLRAGRKVLFSGTSCQVAGLYRYLGKEYDNLLTIDLLCFGASSPGLFDSFVEQIEQRHGKVESYDFGFKSKNTVFNTNRTDFCAITQKSGKIVGSPEVSSFFKMQNQCLTIRPSCFRCEYASPIRPGDITIGDSQAFHMLDNPEDSRLGLSTVLIQTEKGAGLFKMLCEENIVKAKEVDLGELICTGMDAARYLKKDYDQFWSDYHDNGYAFLAEKYGHCNSISEAKYLAKKILRRGK